MNNQDKIEPFIEVLRRDGIVHDAAARITPLTGGVSSEIYRVEDGAKTFVVKRALAKLKVRDDWYADVGRNHSEQLYLSYVAKFLPDAVPAILEARPQHGYFSMEYLGTGFDNWKRLLLDGCCNVNHAQMAGDIMGRIHRCSAGDPEAAKLFDTTANFHQLRLEPYLLTTGQRHPDLRQLFEAEVQRLAVARRCLVHGDFSPKNILIKGQRMVLLDCEVAWYGDPAFDVAFLLNHLLLKALYHAPRDLRMAAMIQTFWKHYTAAVGDVFEVAAFEPQVARLWLMLLLARVDGKSPVEYLTDESRRHFVRKFVYTNLRTGNLLLAELTQLWFSQLHTIEAQK